MMSKKYVLPFAFVVSLFFCGCSTPVVPEFTEVFKEKTLNTSHPDDGQEHTVKVGDELFNKKVLSYYDSIELLESYQYTVPSISATKTKYIVPAGEYACVGSSDKGLVYAPANSKILKLEGRPEELDSAKPTHPFAGLMIPEGENIGYLYFEKHVYIPGSSYVSSSVIGNNVYSTVHSSPTISYDTVNLSETPMHFDYKPLPVSKTKARIVSAEFIEYAGFSGGSHHFSLITMYVGNSVERFKKDMSFTIEEGSDIEIAGTKIHIIKIGDNELTYRID